MSAQLDPIFPLVRNTDDLVRTVLKFSSPETKARILRMTENQLIQSYDFIVHQTLVNLGLIKDEKENKKWN